MTESAHANPFAVVGFMVLLAGLDLTGTMLAKEWTVHRAAWQLFAGGAAFLALFLRSALLRVARRPVVWRGRRIDTRS